jgi:hypothetical protein
VKIVGICKVVADDVCSTRLTGDKVFEEGEDGIKYKRFRLS